MAPLFFLLFASLFVAIVTMYIYMLRLKKRTKESANRFAHDLRIALANKTNKHEALLFLRQIEQRIKSERKYEKNPVAKEILLSKVFQQKASVLFSHSDLKGAIKACSQALSFDPSHITTRLNRGSLYNECMEYHKAIEDFNQVELLDPGNPNLYNNRGWAYSQLGNFERAIEDFTFGISLLPSATLYFNRGNALFATNSRMEALSDYQQALKLNGQTDKQLHTLIEEAIRRVS